MNAEVIPDTKVIRQLVNSAAVIGWPACVCLWLFGNTLDAIRLVLCVVLLFGIGELLEDIILDFRKGSSILEI